MANELVAKLTCITSRSVLLSGWWMFLLHYPTACSKLYSFKMEEDGQTCIRLTHEQENTNMVLNHYIFRGCLTQQVASKILIKITESFQETKNGFWIWWSLHDCDHKLIKQQHIRHRACLGFYNFCTDGAHRIQTEPGIPSFPPTSRA